MLSKLTFSLTAFLCLAFAQGASANIDVLSVLKKMVAEKKASGVCEKQLRVVNPKNFLLEAHNDLVTRLTIRNKTDEPKLTWNGLAPTPHSLKTFPNFQSWAERPLSRDWLIETLRIGSQLGIENARRELLGAVFLRAAAPKIAALEKSVGEKDWQETQKSARALLVLLKKIGQPNLRTLNHAVIRNGWPKDAPVDDELAGAGLVDVIEQACTISIEIKNKSPRKFMSQRIGQFIAETRAFMIQEMIAGRDNEIENLRHLVDLIAQLAQSNRGKPARNGGRSSTETLILELIDSLKQNLN